MGSSGLHNIWRYVYLFSKWNPLRVIYIYIKYNFREFPQSDDSSPYELSDVVERSPTVCDQTRRETRAFRLNFERVDSSFEHKRVFMLLEEEKGTGTLKKIF